MKHQLQSNGKLLLTGEYAILDGALGLALPTKFGQQLLVSDTKTQTLLWKSYDADKTLWFEAMLSLPDFQLLASSDRSVGDSLRNILVQAKTLNPTFLTAPSGVEVKTQLDFPRAWGLGTSSTLINNVAQWAAVDPYELLKSTFGGSGYDIACAEAIGPILFQLKNGKPHVQPIKFDPPFKESLFFVYRNQKQNSREAIAQYRKRKFDTKKLVVISNGITQQLTNSVTLGDFERLLKAHELFLAKVLGTAPIKNEFPDYFGQLKSLGAWGGDFILATGNEKTPRYFKAKGFGTVIPYEDMVL